MKLKVYADRMSEPSRAVIIFCKVNEIDFEEVFVDTTKQQNHSPEYKKINPVAKVPAIVDGRLKLFESHAILTNLACAFPGVADHWYPADLSRRAKIQSLLDWHHSNLRRGAAGYVFTSALAPLIGKPLLPEITAQSEQVLISSLRRIESVWLKGKGPFLLGASQPSLADLSFACQIMQLEVLDEKDRDRFLGPHKKVREWVENTRKATHPHFDEVHKVLIKMKAMLQARKPASGTTRIVSKM